jgi:phage terminase small subunit
MAGGDRLSQRRRRFVAAMLTSPTIEDAAKSAGISERTAYRYLANPDVKAALSSALDDALNQATARAVAAMTAALETLAAIHQDRAAPTGARVSAARAILDAGPRLREAVDLAERVARLEQQREVKR